MTKRILIVEDDVLVGFDLIEQLIECGFDANGPFVTVEDALSEISANGCDAAVLDVNLGRETSEPLAQQLRAKGVPFVVLSGYSRAQQPTGLLGEVLLSKPVSVPELVKSLHMMLPGDDGAKSA